MPFYQKTRYLTDRLKEKNPEVEYKESQSGKHVYSNWYANGIPFTGLRVRIEKDSLERPPYEHFERINRFKPFAPSEYTA